MSLLFAGFSPVLAFRAAQTRIGFFRGKSCSTVFGGTMTAQGDGNTGWTSIPADRRSGMTDQLDQLDTSKVGQTVQPGEEIKPKFDLSTIGADSMNHEFVMCIKTTNSYRRRLDSAYDENSIIEAEVDVKQGGTPRQLSHSGTHYEIIDTGVVIFMTGGCSLVGSTSDFYTTDNADFTIYDVRHSASFGLVAMSQAFFIP